MDFGLRPVKRKPKVVRRVGGGLREELEEVAELRGCLELVGCEGDGGGGGTPPLTADVLERHLRLLSDAMKPDVIDNVQPASHTDILIEIQSPTGEVISPVHSRLRKAVPRPAHSSTLLHVQPQVFDRPPPPPTWSDQPLPHDEEALALTCSSPPNRIEKPDSGILNPSDSDSVFSFTPVDSSLSTTVKQMNVRIHASLTPLLSQTQPSDELNWGSIFTWHDTEDIKPKVDDTVQKAQTPLPLASSNIIYPPNTSYHPISRKKRSPVNPPIARRLPSKKVEGLENCIERAMRVKYEKEKAKQDETMQKYNRNEGKRLNAAVVRGRLRAVQLSEMWVKAVSCIISVNFIEAMGQGLASYKLGYALVPLIRRFLRRKRHANERTAILRANPVPPLSPDRLRQHQLLAAYGDAFIKSMVQQSTLWGYKPGEVITRPGEPITACLIIAKGSVRVETADANHTLHEGDLMWASGCSERHMTHRRKYVAAMGGEGEGVVCYVLRTQVLREAIRAATPEEQEAGGRELVKAQVRAMERYCTLDSALLKEDAVFGVSGDVADEVAKCGIAKVLNEGEVLWKTGDPCTGVYVAEGEGEFAVGGKSGYRVVGSEETVFVAVRRVAPAVAKTRMEAWFIPKTSITHILKSHPAAFYEMRSASRTILATFVPRLPKELKPLPFPAIILDSTEALVTDGQPATSAFHLLTGTLASAAQSYTAPATITPEFEVWSCTITAQTACILRRVSQTVTSKPPG